ncbi:MAG: substrate-binding domain-containing protein [Vicinamibacterales bacterium]
MVKVVSSRPRPRALREFRPFCRSSAATLLFAVALLTQAARASADDIVVMTSGAFTAAYLELSEQFSRATGHRFITATTTMGVGRESIPNRLAAEEPADLVIVSAPDLESLIGQGRIVPGSRMDLAKSSIALAVRTGAAVPDISSVDALKTALLSAKSVAYSASVSGDYLVSNLFPRLGIAEQMKTKGKRIERERVGAVIARGEAEMGFQQVSELRPVPGIQIVGLLPPEVQLVTVFAAGIAAHSTRPDVVREFLAFVVTPAAQAVIVKTGLQQLDGR